MLDSDERAILRYLQHDPNSTMLELSEKTRLSVAKLNRRIDHLKQSGAIERQVAHINWAALGYKIQVSLRISLDKSTPEAFDLFLRAARLIPEVIEIQTFLGQVDVRLSLLAKDLAHYQDLYREKILTLPYMVDLEALMTVANVKQSRGLPL